jgi:hypothetical protein
MVALRKMLPGRISVAEFLVWDGGDGSGRLWPLRHGGPEAMAPATPVHCELPVADIYRTAQPG